MSDAGVLASRMATPRTRARLSRLELEVMEAFWAHGAQSVREALERFPARSRPAYTTVQTIVRRLEQKGAVRLVRKIGNAAVFEPVVPRSAAYARLVTDFLAFFDGRARSLVSHLAEAGQIGLEDLRAAEAILRRRKP